MNTVQPIRDKYIIEKVKTYFRENSPRDLFMFNLGINTGLRISDILKLRVSDVKQKSHIILREKKTGKEKRFIINPAMQEMIKQYISDMEDYEFLIPSRKGGNAITRQQAYRIINDAARAVGITDLVGCHTLRKTFGYWYYQKTHDVAMLQEIFNHGSQRETLRYIGINQDIIDASLKDFSL